MSVPSDEARPEGGPKRGLLDELEEMEERRKKKGKGTPRVKKPSGKKRDKRSDEDDDLDLGRVW